jgi:hypothetical protein
MAATVRLAPPASGNATIKVNGRTYTCAQGATIDVPDFDANEMAGNGWLPLAGTVGATAARPVNPPVGTVFNDTTVGAAVVWNGKAWLHHQSGAVS